MKTNFFGTRDVCTELLPLMKPQGEPDQGPKLWWFCHDASLTSSTDPWTLSLLSHTSLLARSPPGHVPLCLRTHTRPAVSSALCPTGPSQLPQSYPSHLSSERPFTRSMPLTGAGP